MINDYSTLFKQYGDLEKFVFNVGIVNTFSKNTQDFLKIIIPDIQQYLSLFQAQNTSQQYLQSLANFLVYHHFTSPKFLALVNAFYTENQFQYNQENLNKLADYIEKNDGKTTADSTKETWIGVESSQILNQDNTNLKNTGTYGSAVFEQSTNRETHFSVDFFEKMNHFLSEVYETLDDWIFVCFNGGTNFAIY